MVFFNLLKVAKMLVRLLSAVQMWHLKTPISVLNCLVSEHFLSYWRGKTWVKPWLLQRILWTEPHLNWKKTIFAA